MRPLAAALLAVTLTTSVARAGEPADLAKLATELARLQLPRELWDKQRAAIFEQLQSTMGPLAAFGGPDVDAGGRVRKMLDKALPSYEEQIDTTAGLYVKYYTAADMRELAAFMRSPIGQKMLRVQPDMARDVMAWTQERIQKMLPAMLQQMGGGP